MFSIHFNWLSIEQNFAQSLDKRKIAAKIQVVLHSDHLLKYLIEMDRALGFYTKFFGALTLLADNAWLFAFGG